MNHSHSALPPDDDALEATAASWLAQREEGFTPEQEAEFLRWRLADPRHGAAVARLEETCELLEQLPFLRGDPRIEGGIAPTRTVTPTLSTTVGAPGTRTSTVNHRARRFIFTLAALAASLALTAIYWIVPHKSAQSYTTTEKGYQRVLLPDSSVAQLNGGTQLKVDFSDNERRIALAEGEAHFHVAKDASRPFVVSTHGVSVWAVGTAFNVRVIDGAVDVLVTEGVVRIERAGQGAVALLVLASGERALLPPNAAVAPEVAVVKVDAAQVRTALAWQEPRLVFVEATLGEVVSRFNERNRLQLELADPDLSARVVGGTFRHDDVETFVRLIESSGDIAVERSGDRVVLRRAR